ncbi:hypothetical protein Hanom_Chr12g01165221 [Helianthus anomalus]
MRGLRKDAWFSVFGDFEFIDNIQDYIPEIEKKKAMRLKMEREKITVKNIEFKESITSTNEASCSEPMCSNCDKSRSDNDKLLNDLESLTLENQKLKQNEKHLKKSNKYF